MHDGECGPNELLCPVRFLCGYGAAATPTPQMQSGGGDAWNHLCVHKVADVVVCNWYSICSNSLHILHSLALNSVFIKSGFAMLEILPCVFYYFGFDLQRDQEWICTDLDRSAQVSNVTTACNSEGGCDRRPDFLHGRAFRGGPDAWWVAIYPPT